MSTFQSIKLWLVGNLGLAKDALHVHIVLLVFFGCALIFRWPLRSWKPWAVALTVALAGEALDLRDSSFQKMTIDLWGNWKDVWNAMIWPTAILVMAHTSTLFGIRERSAPAE